jgi:hypothetical protein
MAFFGVVGIFVEGGFMNTLINFYQVRGMCLSAFTHSFVYRKAPERYRYFQFPP